MKTKGIVMGALVLVTVPAAPPALAEEFNCTGTVGAVALDNVFVPDGASCVLNRTRMNGNIVVGTGARLSANSVTVNGNLQAEGAAFVGVGGYSIIGGSVQIVQGGAAAIDTARINGDLQFKSNANTISADGNTVGGSLQAFQNLGGVSLNNNTMNGNLQCKENIPAPTGGANISPSKEDQCAGL